MKFNFLLTCQDPCMHVLAKSFNKIASLTECIRGWSKARFKQCDSLSRAHANNLCWHFQMAFKLSFNEQQQKEGCLWISVSQFMLFTSRVRPRGSSVIKLLFLLNMRGCSVWIPHLSCTLQNSPRLQTSLSQSVSRLCVVSQPHAFIVLRKMNPCFLMLTVYFTQASLGGD